MCIHLATAITLYFSLMTFLSAEVITHVSSKDLVAGEMIQVTYQVTDLPFAPPPPRITVPGASFSYSNNRVDRANGKLYYTFYYEFKAGEPGVFTIPSLDFNAKGTIVSSQKIQLTVHHLDRLHQGSLKTNGRTHSYYTLLSSNKTQLYPNQSTRVKFKVYIPEVLNVALWGLPLGEKENCNAWRFKTPSNLDTAERIVIAGKIYQIAMFQANLTAGKTGPATLGPLKTRIVHNVKIYTPRGISTKALNIHVVSEPLHLTVLPLPPNAPENFNGAVGRFQIEAEIDAKSEIKDSESIQATVRIGGIGNLSGLIPPTLTKLKAWQLIAQNETDRGKNRKNIGGITEFTYLIQPKLLKEKSLETTTPGFIFTYLDPELSAFRTIELPGKPITILKSETTSAEETSSNTPQEPAQLDINDIITKVIPLNKNSWLQALSIHFISIIHTIFAVLAMAILAIKIKRTLASRKLLLQDYFLKKQEFKALTQTETDFLKSAGNFVEKWIDTTKHPEALVVIKERDAKCFRPEEEREAVLNDSNRNKIIALIKKCTFLILVPLCITTVKATEDPASSSFKTGVEMYQNDHFENALNEFKKAPNSAQNLYNIGNCYYRMKNPANAAYHYHLSLALDPDLIAATQNLKLIELENNSVTTTHTDLESWVSEVGIITYQNSLTVATWIVFLSILTLLMLKPHRSKLGIIIATLLVSLLLVCISLFGYMKHPKKPFNGLQKAIVMQNTKLHREPLENSQTTTTAPIASECYIIADRGEFMYVTLLSGEKAWILTNMIKSLSPSN